MALRVGTLDDKLSVSYTESWLKSLSKHSITFDLQYFKDDTELLSILGQTGIPFYEMLHESLVEKQIDVFLQPTEWAPLFLKEGLEIAAFLPREHNPDVLAVQVDLEFLSLSEATVGVSSLRTKAQWIHKYPSHTVSLSQRDTHDRLQEVSVGDLNGGVFSYQELDRLTFDQYIETELNWMVAAPGQGSYVLICRSEDEDTKHVLKQFNDEISASERRIERDILKKLGIDQRYPIGLECRFADEKLRVRGFLSDSKGTHVLDLDEQFSSSMENDVARIVVEKWMEAGAHSILKELSSLDLTTF